MQLNQFISFVSNFAKEKSIQPVVVFSGKREIPTNEIPKLNALGALLSEKCPDFLFRAGNQNGADKEFVAQINPSKVQIVPPYRGHRGANIPLGASICSLDEIVVSNSAQTYLKNTNKSLYSAYLAGRGRMFQQSRYLMRNLAMLYGFDKNGLNHPQASILLYWDDLSNPKQGGTGFTIAAAKAKGVSPLGQKVWSKYL